MSQVRTATLTSRMTQLGSRTRTGALVLALIALGTGSIAGCGSGRLRSVQTVQTSGAHATPGGDGAQVAVIRDWADALRRGDVSAAANYFAVPSLFANGVGANGQLAVVEIHSQAEARAVNASLSCGAQLTSTRRQGRYIVAAFRLTNRLGPGAGCGSGAGEPASTDFLIRNGRIVEWIRAPAGTPPRELPAPPANPQSPGTQV